jgi:hypothetical protein
MRELKMNEQVSAKPTAGATGGAQPANRANGRGNLIQVWTLDKAGRKLVAHWALETTGASEQIVLKSAA